MNLMVVIESMGFHMTHGPNNSHWMLKPKILHTVDVTIQTYPNTHLSPDGGLSLEWIELLDI